MNLESSRYDNACPQLVYRYDGDLSRQSATCVQRIRNLSDFRYAIGNTE